MSDRYAVITWRRGRFRTSLIHCPARLDTTYFTGTPSVTAWSSTLDPVISGDALAVTLCGGELLGRATDASMTVRCVR